MFHTCACLLHTTCARVHVRYECKLHTCICIHVTCSCYIRVLVFMLVLVRVHVHVTYVCVFMLHTCACVHVAYMGACLCCYIRVHAYVCYVFMCAFM